MLNELAVLLGATLPLYRHSPGEQQNGIRKIDPTVEVSAFPEPLRKLPPGEWVSLGGYLDYQGWPDRERFIQLDRAIAARATGGGRNRRNTDTDARN